MLAGLSAARGVGRSLRLYYGDPARREAMVRFYGRFVPADALVFDIGAHVGDRVAAFRSLGARVVAVEPQPALVRVLRRLYGRDRAVTIEPCAVGRTDGRVTLRLNLANPTVSTASEDFIAAARGAPGWEDQEWGACIDVPMLTLDALVARHGVPDFMKIDVEGFEAEALHGLTRPPPILSFEFTTIQRGVALTALERCAALGYRGFDAAIGESLTLEHGRWIAAEAMAHWLDALPQSANSGDVYATLA
ncbi:MAG TPA: FkbM family methyltransferase [Xanthobacteraceae bacterium]|nr:FkbM family methyltransferase [Xanthobacteraceae bacterium]